MRSNAYSADVVVVGGGISGVVSAITTARQGVRVVLIEKSSCLGGCATAGLLGEINGVSLHGKNVLPKIGQEIIERLIQDGAGLLEANIPMTSNPEVRVDRFRYNGEYLKLVLDEMVEAESIQVFLSCEVRSVREREDKIQVEIGNAYETLQVEGALLIDSTGNSQCVYQLGGETKATKREDLQASTVIFRMGGVDIERFLQIPMEEIQSIIRAGEAGGVLPAHILSMVRIPGTKDVAVNCTRLLRLDYESLEEVSQGYLQLRKQIRRIVPFLKARVPGCENAYLSNIAAALGVRDCRRTVGLYELTGEDLVACRDFDDAVAVGVYPIDIHNSKKSGEAVSFQQIGGNGIYKIPYRCFVPRNLEHVLVNGKGLCADHKAFGAFRIMGPLISIATAAGTAAAQVVTTGCRTRDVDISRLKERLRECGTIEI